jgi:predicted MFS family arabinose efflux permease
MKPALHPARRFLWRFGRPHIILPVSFLNSTAGTIVGLGFVYYLRDGYGATASTIGLSAALYSSLYFVGCFALRPLTTRLLPRYSLILSSLLAGSGLLVIVAVSSLPLMVAIYGMVGFTVALFWPPVMGWLAAGYEGQGLNRVIARFNLAWSAGGVIGPFVAGLLTEVDLRLPLFVGAALILVNAAIIGLASILVGTIRDDRYLERPAGSPAGPDASTPLRFPAWVAVVAAYVALGTILIVFPLYGREVLGLPESRVGAILLLRGLAASLTFILVGSSERWHFRRAAIPVPQALLAVTLVLMVFARTSIAFTLLIGLMGAAVAGAYTMSVFHGAAGSTDRTRRMAIHEALLTVGSVAGSAIGGALYQHRGSDAALLFCLAVVLTSLVIQAILLLIPRRAASTHSG